MANIIKPKRSTVAAKVPTTAQLVSGEIAINSTDQKIYTYDGTNILQIGAGKLSGHADVTLTSLTTGQTLSWNGTAWINSSAGSGTVTSVAALTLGTTGTDVSSTVATGTTTPVITLNIPTASASNRGALSAADWSTFNGKQAALGFTPLNPTTSQTANTIYAAPNGSAGAPTFRALATADLPTTIQTNTYAPGILGSANNAVAAAGTTQGTATALTSDVNVVTTAAANSGVILPNANAGKYAVVVNNGANAVNVYPATGHSFDGLAANAPISLPVNAFIELYGSSTTKWNTTYQALTQGQFVIGNIAGNAATATTATTANALNAANSYTGVSFNGTSDERVKTNWRDLPDDFVELLCGVKSGTYDRTDVNISQVGVSAQSLQGLLPEAVSTDENGMLSVSYGNAALAACIMLAKRVVALEELLNQKG